LQPTRSAHRIVVPEVLLPLPDADKKLRRAILAARARVKAAEKTALARRRVLGDAVPLVIEAFQTATAMCEATDATIQRADPLLRALGLLPEQSKADDTDVFVHSDE
jgi:hypothetical protein